MPNTCEGPIKSKSDDGENINNFNQQNHNKPPSPVKFLTNESDLCCKKCDKAFEGKNKHGVQCDRCDAWFHQPCSNLTKKEHQMLHNSNHNNFKWYCSSCSTSDCGKIDPTLSNLLARQATQMETLTTLVLKLAEQNSEVIKQNNKIIDSLSSEKKTEEKIKTNVNEALNDQMEREMKKNNLILYGVEEGKDANEEKNNENDLSQTKQLFKHVNPDITPDNIVKIQRIGFKKADKTRPVKVVMKSEESKLSILKNARRLKESETFSKVGISYDKTKKQQEEYRKLKDEVDEKNKPFDKKVYVIFRNKVTKASDIPSIIKNTKKTEDKLEKEDNE